MLMLLKICSQRPGKFLKSVVPETEHHYCSAFVATRNITPFTHSHNAKPKPYRYIGPYKPAERVAKQVVALPLD